MRKPLRLTGGLLINPRRAKKRATSAAKFRALKLSTLTPNPRRKRKAARRNPKRKLKLRTFGALTVNPRKRRTKRRLGALTVNPRRRRTKRRLSGLRANPRRKRVYGRARRNPRRKARSKVRVLRLRSNPRRHKRRKNPHGRRRARRNPAGLSKIPVIGPLLASFASFLPHAVFGAISVEPTMAVASLVGRFAPGLPASATYALAGSIAAAGISMLPFGSRDLRAKLAIAAASAGGGIAYYKWRSGQDTDAGSEMHGLMMAGYGGPMGLLTATPNAFAGAGYGAYADAGPMWVGPMG